jgi:PilZ domain
MSDTNEDKRRAPRRRVLKGAIVAYNDRRSTLSCTVRDISDTGARLRMGGSINAPDTFLLIIELDGFEADCRVVWRKAPDLAVTFVSPPRKVPPKRSQSVAALVPEGKPSLRRKLQPS